MTFENRIIATAICLFSVCPVSIVVGQNTGDLKDVILLQSGEQFTVPAAAYARIEAIMYNHFFQSKFDSGDGSPAEVEFCGKKFKSLYREEVISINDELVYFGTEPNSLNIGYSELPIWLGGGDKVCVPDDHQTQGISIVIYQQ